MQAEGKGRRGDRSKPPLPHHHLLSEGHWSPGPTQPVLLHPTILGWCEKPSLCGGIATGSGSQFSLGLETLLARDHQAHLDEQGRRNIGFCHVGSHLNPAADKVVNKGVRQPSRLGQDSVRFILHPRASVSMNLFPSGVTKVAGIKLGPRDW